MELTKNKGVYFVANDRVLDLAIAFLNSFRESNPDISLCLIPFRNDIEEISKLQSKYRFSIYSNNEFLTFCDEISRKFHGKTVGHYRKLAIWNGPFDEFIYIDIDMLVLKNIDFAFRYLVNYSFITSCSDLESTEKWVWKKSIYETGKLSKEQIQYAANTGFIVSRKNAISQDDIKKSLPQAVELAPHMELSCMDQPFINYLIVTSGKRFSSLLKMQDTPNFTENYVEFWAGSRKKDLLENMQTNIDGKIKDIFLFHWAGEWQLRKWEIRLYILLNLFKLRKNIWTISLIIPFRKIWKHYRYLDMK